MLPDPKYNSKLVAKFMKQSHAVRQKSLAEQIFYGALDIIEQRSKQDPLEVFHKALDNVRPVIEVKSRRVGEQPPGPGRSSQRAPDALAMRWILNYSSSALK